jgi:hypothetical protein
LPARRQSFGNHQSPQRSKPLTGEPDAGTGAKRRSPEANPQVPFGGGSGANQCAVPTSILLPLYSTLLAAKNIRLRIRQQAGGLTAAAGCTQSTETGTQPLTPPQRDQMVVERCASPERDYFHLAEG